MLTLGKVKLSTFWKLYFDVGILKIMESERTSFSSHPHSRLLPSLSKSWLLRKSPLWDSFPPGQLTSEQCRGKSEKWPHQGKTGLSGSIDSAWVAEPSWPLKCQEVSGMVWAAHPQVWKSPERPGNREASFGCVGRGPTASHGLQAFRARDPFPLPIFKDTSQPDLNPKEQTAKDNSPTEGPQRRMR